MDQTPFDPTRADASYEEQPAELFPPDAGYPPADEPQYFDPSQQEAESTPSGDDAPPADWRERLERAETTAQAAARRAQEAEQFQADLRRMAQQQQEMTRKQQRQAFLAQIDDMTPDQIRQEASRHFAEEEARANEARQQAQQIVHRDTVAAFKREYIAPTYNLTQDEMARLDRYDFSHDPNQYERLAQDIVAERQKFSTLETRLAAVEREREAEERIDGRYDRVGGSGGGPAFRGNPRLDPSSPNYDSRAHLAAIMGVSG